MDSFMDSFMDPFCSVRWGRKQGQHVLFMEPVEMQKAQGFCIYLLAPRCVDRVQCGRCSDLSSSFPVVTTFTWPPFTPWLRW